MNKTGVIINPKSGRGRGKGVALAEALRLQENTGVDVCVMQSFEDLYSALERFAAQKVETLFISSGDGTVQAIQTWIAETGRYKTFPKLCLLPHGTTNMTAADLGFQRRNIESQAQFIANIDAKTIRSRKTVRVANPKNRPALHGMFFGTGAISEAVRYCQSAFNDNGIGGNWAGFATLASALGKTMIFSPNPNDPKRFDRPYPITLTTNGKLQCAGPQLFMLATTLEKLILSTRPFWGGATAPMRTTTMPYPVPNIPRWIFPVMYGAEARKGPSGSTSNACHTCEVTCPTQFIMDGEFYDAPDDEPLRLETGPTFEYIVA